MRALVLTVLAASGLLAGGCGFQPLYADRTGATAELSSFRIVTGEGRSEYLLRQSLLDALNTREGAADAIYELSADVTERRQGFGVRIDRVVTRYEMAVTVNYVVRRVEDGSIVHRGQVSGASSYDAPNEAYALIAVEERARERAVDLAADRVRFDLALFFADRDA